MVFLIKNIINLNCRYYNESKEHGQLTVEIGFDHGQVDSAAERGI